MTPEKSNTSTSKVCPTCGTRLSENATRCLVCGRNFTTTTTTNTKTAQANPVESPRLPELKLSLPLALGLIVAILLVGAAIVFFILRGTGLVASPTATPTVSPTPTNTATARPTSEPTLAATATPLAPIEYVVQAGDLCSSLAARYNVSITSIEQLNNLSSECVLTENQKILIPQPTPTPTSLPTATLSPAEATESACGTLQYQVADNDTLSSISANYNISVESIKNFNKLSSDIVWKGMYLSLPLCERLPTEGPTPTATTPPPYPAPSLLLPVDGIVYSNITDTITLQWSSVGTLRQNEAYQVTIEDVTSGGTSRSVQYVTDTKLTVPATLRPLDNTSHIFRWWVIAARQSGTNTDGTPIYETNGATSEMRVFGWAGTNTTNPTPAQ
jgi:LysM repeat protein